MPFAAIQQRRIFMIETGRWVLHINNMFMHEDLTGQINVAEDGSFELFAVTEEGLRPFPKEVTDKLTIDGDTLSAEVAMDEMPGMKVKVSVTFSGDEAEGYFKFPIIGKMKFKGEKLELTELPIIERKPKKESDSAENAGEEAEKTDEKADE